MAVKQKKKQKRIRIEHCQLVADPGSGPDYWLMDSKGELIHWLDKEMSLAEFMQWRSDLPVGIVIYV